MVSRYDVTPDGLAEVLDGEPAYRVRQVWDGLHRRAAEPAELTDLPRSLRTRLAEVLPPALEPVVETTADSGTTVKWLWRLQDGAVVESVLMVTGTRATVCISSQAGCAMGCGFCATGQAGFRRHLTVGEMVEQVVRAVRRARPAARVSNVVFMGMGEPLANTDRVLAALQRFSRDLGLSARSLTVSTVGLVPGIHRLADAGIPATLAVSLHAANDALRDELVPINRRYPLDVLLGTVADHASRTGRRPTIEWALIDGVNDRASDAAELAERARPLGAHVNLIPLNPTPGYATPGTPMPGVRAFCAGLQRRAVNATVRRTRGRDIDAACGQLAAAQPVTIGGGGPRR